MTHGLRVTGTGLVSMGLGLLAFVVLTLINGDPFTAASARSAQKELAQGLAAQNSQFVPSAKGSGTSKPDPRLTRADARRYRKSLKLGDPAGRISAPSIGLRTVVVNGTGVPELKKGPGLYPEAGFPGMGAPVGIAGHRTTYGAPFLDVDKLKRGQNIFVDMPYGRFTYSVTRTVIIQPTDWSILEVGAGLSEKARELVQEQGGACPGGNCEHLVLTACNPKYSAAQRIAVLARLESVDLKA